ncbi:unnamed protein product [Closterium sp. NIES-54]
MSQSLMIAAGILCSRTMVEMKRRAVSSAVIDFLQVAKCAIFISRSTTTRIASFPLAPAGNPVTKSIVTCCQARSGGGIGCNCPAGHFRDDFMSWQWLTRDAAARLAIRNHLQLAECAHFGQHRTAQALYDAVVARYSSPATAALGRLLLPYLSPELSAFATEEDLVSHLCASDARYRAATPSEFLDKNQPPMFITLYFIITRLSDSLRSVRDHFLSLDPTVLTIDLLEQHLLVAETSVVALGAACGTPRTPFFEGCSPSPLAPSYASVAVVDVLGAEDVGAASASSKHRSSKGKGGRGGGSGSEGGGGGSSGGGGGSSVAPPCSCRLLTHHTLLLHHRLSHPSLPRLNGMLSRLLVSCLPKSLPPVPPLPAPPCLPCVEGRQRAAPHSSSSPPTTAPLQTLHMDSVSSFASCSAKTFLSCVCTLDRGGEFCSDLLRDFCRGDGILQSHGGRLYLRDPCGCSPFSVAGCGPVRCASAASESASPPSVGGEYALSTDVLEDRQEDFDCLTAAVPRFASMLLAPEGDPDAPDIPTPRSEV